jgi:hypothetical protein
MMRGALSALQTARQSIGGENFFTAGKNFAENMLHNSNSFVQLRTSDHGVHAFR